ncbi:MAG: sensor histidine kinase [Microcystaceae cyanobacterium]
MKPLSHWFKQDSTSLRWRLTLGVAIVSMLGLGGVVFWISWRMQQILIATHKQSVVYIAERFPHDIEIYSDMVSLEIGAQKAINNLTNPQTLLWIKSPEGNIIAASEPLQMKTQGTELVNLVQVAPKPELQRLNNRYWLMCATTLKVNGQNIGEFYIAQDITGDQIMFLSLMKSLSLATAIAICLMTILIAWYVRRSLQPLERISNLSATLSIDQLPEARLKLDNAPLEVKKLAHTFDQMLDRLSQAWEHQQQLLSNVSHELRTPLTIVTGYLQSTLRRGNNLTQPQREALETAASEAERTTQLLQDLLDLARADSGQMMFHRDQIVLNRFIAEVIAMTQQYSDRTIEFNAPDTPIEIKADMNRLKQVLLNLIDNAIKYTPDDSLITINLKKEQENAIIEVCDQGQGIPLADQARIFERFYRVDEARSRNTGGTGLGLSIVKTLVEGMGGQISVTSKPHKGSIFTVSF